MPNLEQTGLLRVDYATSTELAADEDSWAGTHPVAARRPSRSTARSCAGILLDELRRVLAIDVDCLTEDGFDQLQRQRGQHLIEPWALAEQERAGRRPASPIPRPGRRGGTRGDLLPVRPRRVRPLPAPRAPASALPGPARGRRRPAGHRATCSTVLDRRRAAAPGRRAATATAPAATGSTPSALRWRAGDGEHRRAATRCASTIDAEATARVNPFFRDLYRDVAGRLRRAARRASTPPRCRPRTGRSARSAFRARRRCRCCTARRRWSSASTSPSLNAVGAAQRPADAGQLRPALAAGPAAPASRRWSLTYCATGNAHDQLLLPPLAATWSPARSPPPRSTWPTRTWSAPTCTPSGWPRPASRPASRASPTSSTSAASTPVARAAARGLRERSPTAGARAGPRDRASGVLADAAATWLTRRPPWWRRRLGRRPGRRGAPQRFDARLRPLARALPGRAGRVPEQQSRVVQTTSARTRGPPQRRAPPRGRPRPAAPAAQRGRRRRRRPTSTPTATSPPRGSCPATPSPGCRSPPTSRRPRRRHAATATTCSGPGSSRSASSARAR